MMIRSGRYLLSGVVLAIGVLGLTEAGAATTAAACASAPVTLHVQNALPKFLKFYNAAVVGHLTSSQRWALWKKNYGIAAVPPTPQGQALARKLLGQVWNRYPGIVPQLTRDATRAEHTARSLLPRVTTLLHSCTQPVDVNLVLFVGEFSGNAFTIPGRHGVPATVYLPLEMGFEAQRISLAHEFTHAVHAEVDNLEHMYLEPLGEVLLKEGLAMRASEHLVPGQAMTAYTPATVYGPSWQRTCPAKRQAILLGMLPFLASDSEAVIQRFTYGEGTTGMHDEVYCAGWIIVGGLLGHGYTYATIARVPEPEMPRFVANTIKRSLRSNH